MSEEIGKDIGNNIGNYVETNKRSWQTNQAKFMQICVELQIDKPLRKGGGYIKNMENERVWVTFKYERLPTVCYVCGRMRHDDWHSSQATKGQEVEHQYGEWLGANGNHRGNQYKVKTRKDDSTVSNGGSEETRSQPPMAVMDDTTTDSGGGAQKSNGCQENEKADG